MVTIRRVYVAEPVYAPDAAQRREPVRAEHLANAESLMADGRLLLAGAYEDMSASLLIFTVDSEDAALDLIHADVYWRTCVWTDVAIRPLNQVLPGT